MVGCFPLSGWGLEAVIRMWALGLLALMAGALAACAENTRPLQTRWDAYYAIPDAPSAHVVVVPPEGTTLPMAKLIARYVVENLHKQKISAEIGDGQPGQGHHFILTGTVEDNLTDPQVRFRRVMRWLLSDAGGRLIATHAEGIEGSEDEWDFGSARLLEAIGIQTAGPVAQMVLLETKAPAPIDPLRQGLLVDTVMGVSPEDAQALLASLKEALRTTDVIVTGDPRQAAYHLTGQVETTPVSGDMLKVRITWVVASLDNREMGRAVQENQIPAAQIQGGWRDLAPRVGQAAALGVEHVFGLRSGPAPGAANRALGDPPAVVLPGESGRALPPPQ
ncbi:MAG: hypothetical protein NUV50_02535 [Rhodospirillales bacterium]|nr:hypothetical protein [Rhodospirillales bacterium]